VISFHTDHRLLAIVPVGVFLALSLVIAVFPAIQENRRFPPSGAALPESVARGREIYRMEGCTYCHTQQVRQDTRRPRGTDGRFPPLESDARFGRPTRPEDYADDDPPFLGTQRTGPDLQDTGGRIDSEHWHYTHLFDPRLVVPGSVMPRFPWYFRGKDDRVPGTDKEVILPKSFVDLYGSDVEVWATPEAQDLVAYLLSLSTGQDGR
jgi:cytochrome c oxidase cbb3-type subunit 2